MKKEEKIHPLIYLWSIAGLDDSKNSQCIDLDDHKYRGNYVVDQQKLLWEPVDDEGDVAENQNDIQCLSINHKKCSYKYHLPI